MFCNQLNRRESEMENRVGYVRRRLCTVGVKPSTGGGSVAEHSRKQKVVKTAEILRVVLLYVQSSAKKTDL